MHFHSPCPYEGYLRALRFLQEGNAGGDLWVVAVIGGVVG